MGNFFNNLWSGFSNAYTGIESWASSLFSFSGRALPIEAIADQVDPRFIPQAPMSGEKIDVDTRLQMSQHGFKHAKLITAESHPELFAHWTFLCKRAGFRQPLQLILSDSDIPNAFAISSSEMGMSTGLLQHLTYREVSAVLSHELGHANNFEKQKQQHVAAAGGLSILGLALPWTGKVSELDTSWHQSRNRGIAAFGSSLIGQVTGSKISGYATELEADLEGAVISHDPDALISALTKLHGEFGKLPSWQQALSKVFDVHPDLKERERWLNDVKQQLEAAPQAPVAITSTPQRQIAAGETQVERVSTNSLEPAISGA